RKTAHVAPRDYIESNIFAFLLASDSSQWLQKSRPLTRPRPVQNTRHPPSLIPHRRLNPTRNKTKPDTRCTRRSDAQRALGSHIPRRHQAHSLPVPPLRRIRLHRPQERHLHAAGQTHTSLLRRLPHPYCRPRSPPRRLFGSSRRKRALSQVQANRIRLCERPKGQDVQGRLLHTEACRQLAGGAREGSVFLEGDERLRRVAHEGWKFEA
ncbi:hypothetical protein BU16DRAFT_615958, partial [Lophium mytilinum]